MKQFYNFSKGLTGRKTALLNVLMFVSLLFSNNLNAQTCSADAGTLTADATPVQLSGASVTISATQGTAP
ncbi:hypothetical protein, partial [Xanthomarina sp. F2636L]|uniref:hypothetical protein n=1 Tax=Xanthomarina sp. F2636L TaxID=2996018 RepID=UPI00225E5AEA